MHAVDLVGHTQIEWITAFADLDLQCASSGQRFDVCSVIVHNGLAESHDSIWCRLETDKTLPRGCHFLRLYRYEER